MQLDQLEIDANNRLANELLLLPFDKVKEIYLDLCDVIEYGNHNKYEYTVLAARKKMIEDLVRRYKGIVW